MYNDDILYIIYYNNILYCYVDENQTLLLNKAKIFNKNIIIPVPVLKPTSLIILTNCKVIVNIFFLILNNRCFVINLNTILTTRNMILSNRGYLY